ncbi:MAG: UDP-N-acetylmuramoyl-tripeptide--D-alanyl-D-alanine ligase [Parcubacteria group bacterium]
MKQQIQRNIESKIAAAARAVLARYKPSVIAITGSVGKTSSKDAIAAVLAQRESVRASEGNYNNELGLPLTILGERSPGRSVLGWWKLLRRADKLARGGEQSYPKVLILEMAMDHPGDLAKLALIAKPDISVVTNVGESHLEFFPDVAAIAQEKATIVKALGPEGLAILNVDNEWTRKMGQGTEAKVMTIGIEHEADIRGTEVHPTDQLPDAVLQDPTILKLRGLGLPLGTAFKISYQGKSVPVRLPRVLGNQQVYSALVAAAVGLRRGMNLVEISEALLHYVSPLGRMNLIAGLKNSLIIDDTYNASPASTIAALDVLAELKPAGRRIAVLGDMAELGTATESGHMAVGKRAASACDFAVFVGQKSKWAAQAAEAEGLVDQCQTQVMDSRQVEAVLQPVLRQGDVILVKGSQVMRMERVVKALMAEPEQASTLLVRQTGLWENKV